MSSPDIGWDAGYSPDGLDVHVRPLRDHVRHELGPECPCGPEILLPHPGGGDGPDRWLYLHHALDGRPPRTGGYTITPHPVHGHHGDGGQGLAGCPA